MSRPARVGELCAGAAVLAALSCARFGYELLPEASFDPGPDDTNVTHGGSFGGTGGANDASAGGASAAVDASAASGSGGAGSSLDAGDTSGSGGAGSSLDAGNSGGSGAVSNGGTGSEVLPGCAPAVATATWSFASDTQGWQLEADPGASGNLSWTGATGDPAPGAVQIDATVANSVNNVRLLLDQSPSDFTGKVIYARVFMESGSGVTAKVFVQTGASAWGDGHEAYLVAQQWQCVTLDFQDPDVVTPGFDRTAVRTLGVFFFGDASTRLYVDQISY